MSPNAPALPYHRIVTLFALVAAAVILMPARTIAAASPPVIAVLVEAGVPNFMADPALYPDDIVRALNRCGLRAVPLTAAEVASRRFDAHSYAALVLSSGNTFPQVIAENVTRFHRAGGSIISFGVPFTHPCIPAGPLGWSMVAGGANPIVRDESDPHSGRYSLRLERRGGPALWTGAISERFAAAVGDRFRITAWVRTRGTFSEQDCVYVRFFGAAGKFLAQTGPRFPADCRAWTELRQEVEAPAGTRTVDVCPAVFRPGTVWLDDLRLAQAHLGAPNLVRDGGFEGSVAGLWNDVGHSESYRGHQATGAGGFRIIQAPDGFAAPGAARWLGMTPAQVGAMPAAPGVCVADFPQDRVVAIAGPTKDGRLAGGSTALIIHRCAEFPGAVDLYASTQSPSPEVSVRLAVCGAARVLRERGLIGEATMRRVQALGCRWSTPVRPLVRLPAASYRGDMVFPKPLAPARSLLLVDLESLSAPDRLTVAALQGLLNRPVPRVYVQDEWADDMRRWGYTLTKIAPEDLLIRRGKIALGLVVYDPSMPATATVAVTLCGVRGWLPVQPDQLQRIGPHGSLLRLPIRADLRGRWRSDAQVYAWALKVLRPLCTDRVLCHEKQMEPLSPGAVNVAITIVDYVVQQRIFCFHLNRSWTREDRRVAEAILASYPANTPIIGHFGPEPNGAPNLANEADIVELASRYAKFYVFYLSPNGSVHAGFPTRPLRQPHVAVPPLDRSKVYVTPYLSDGDSPTTFYQGRERWADPARGSIPIGWSLGPTALELCPKVMEWFYDHATPNDCFVAACSGAGYMYPHVYGASIVGRKEAMREYLRLTDRQMRRADLSVAHIHHVAGCTDADLDLYARDVSCLAGIMADYGRVVSSYPASHRSGPRGVSILHALTGFMPPDTGTQAQQWVSQLAATVPNERPAWVHFFAVVWFSNPSDVAAAVHAFPNDYVTVRADTMAALYSRNSAGKSAIYQNPGLPRHVAPPSR